MRPFMILHDRRLIEYSLDRLLTPAGRSNVECVLCGERMIPRRLLAWETFSIYSVTAGLIVGLFGGPQILVIQMIRDSAVRSIRTRTSRYSAHASCSGVLTWVGVRTYPAPADD